MKKYRSEVWAVTKPEIILDIFKMVAEFGVVIAAIKEGIYNGGIWSGKEWINVHFIFPFCEKDNDSCFTIRAFNKALFAISEQKEHVFPDGTSISTYNTPISPYAPGIGPVYDLKDCLFVPENFSTISKPVEDE